MKLKDLCPKYFRDQRLPKDVRLVGYAAIIHNLKIRTPLQDFPACVSDQYKKKSTPDISENFFIYGKRYWPGEELLDHLEFSLRREIFDLLCLNRIINAIPEEIIESWLIQKPTSIYARRIWFLYEYLTGKKIPIKDLEMVTVKPLLDPKKYYTNLAGPVSKRHRIQNNLLGNQDFCPVIQRTEKLESAIKQKFDEQAKECISQVSTTLVMRAASFLLLADTQASFAIEGERAPRTRIERWLKAVANAGRNLLDLDELVRLHRILIQDDRFTKIGVRDEEVFLGERDEFNLPLPEFIGVKKQDLHCLLSGFFQAAATLAESNVDVILHATALAFGFVYIHPHVDGNGRMHRFILHHVMARMGYIPKGIIFPISSVLLERIEDYRLVLTSHSRPLMEYIDWEPTDKGNVQIKNETIDLYKYFDCTKAAEFIYECVEHAIKKSIPSELDFLKAYDDVLKEVDLIVEMPNERARRLIHYIRENKGQLGKKRRESEFTQLTDQELKQIENLISRHFANSHR